MLEIIIKDSQSKILTTIKGDDNFSQENIHQDYRDITKRLIETQSTITTMESCTSGFIASLITDTEGSSAVLKGAYITYSNQAKIKIGVPEEIIKKYGVYSFETAMEMAKACQNQYNSDYGIGVTGSLGNTDPLNKDSVPGEVFFAISTGEETKGYFVQLIGNATRFQWKLTVAKAIYYILKEVI